MVMDQDIARWILDFLARQPIDDSTLTDLLKTLPVSDTDSNLKKLLILRNIESEISSGKVSENVLDLLELMEELEFRDNVKVVESMKRAYLSVAVDCTVRVLENEGLDGYFVLVKKIWGSRIGSMLECENVGLVSYDLINWKEDIERAIWDERVCKEVLKKWEGMEVVDSVRKYVKDAREKMGPSFLEVVCEEMSDEALRQVFGSNMEEDENEGSHDQADATKASNMEGNNTAVAREKPSFPKVVADDMSADEDTHDQTNATEASLKEGNKTVLDESTDGAAGPASGPQLPTRKKSAVSPVKKDENPKPLRRKRKPWSNVEEDTLRTGVKKYGVGNWTFILNEYKDIFDDRTAVDLKDKWRNLIV